MIPRETISSPVAALSGTAAYDARRDSLATSVAILEARVAVVRDLLAGKLFPDDLPIASEQPPHGPDDVPAYTTVRALIKKPEINPRRRPTPDPRASVRELIGRHDAAAPMVEAVDAWIEYADVTRALAELTGSAADDTADGMAADGETGAVLRPVGLRALEPNDFERALAGIFPLFARNVIDVAQSAGTFRSDVGGTVERIDGYLAVRDERDGRAYAYGEPRDLGRVVYVVAAAARGAGGVPIDADGATEVHRIRENRADAFLTALEDDELPDPHDLGQLRRALAAYVDLSAIARTLVELAAAQQVVQVYDVPGYGDTLAIGEAAAREVLRAAPELEASPEYVRMARIGYVRVATAVDVYAAVGGAVGSDVAGSDVAGSDAAGVTAGGWRAELVAAYERAKAHAPPTRLIAIDTLQAELDRRLSGAAHDDRDVARVLDVAITAEERQRLDVLMRGLLAMGVDSLRLRPEKQVELLSDRLHEIDAATAEALSHVGVVPPEPDAPIARPSAGDVRGR